MVRGWDCSDADEARLQDVDSARLQDLLRWAEESESERDDLAAVGRIVRGSLSGTDPGRADLAEARRWAEAAWADGSAAVRARSRAVLVLASELDLRAKAREQQRRRWPRVRLSAPATLAAGAAAVVFGAAVVGAVLVARMAFAPSLDVEGPSSGAAIGIADAAKLAFAVEAGAGALAKERWRLDGRDVTARVRVEGARLVLRPGRLRDGEHTLEVTQGGDFLGASTRHRLLFTVDLTPADAAPAEAPAGPTPAAARA